MNCQRCGCILTKKYETKICTECGKEVLRGESVERKKTHSPEDIFKWAFER